MQVSISYRSILRLALPLCAALLIPQLNLFINTAFLGHRGEAELGVIGVAGLFYLALSMVGYGLASGEQIQMSRRAGEGDEAGIMALFRNGLFLSAGFAAVLLAVAWWGGPLLFKNTLTHSSTAAAGTSFLHTRMWGLPFLLATQLGNALCIASGRSRVIMWGTAAGTAVNIAGDYFLIFGHGPAPALGLQGAALASVAAEVVACAVLYGALYGRRVLRRPAVRGISFDATLARRTLMVASPLVVQYVVGLGGWQAFFIFVEHLGARELAVSQMLRSVYGLVGVGTWAFANTANTMVSNLIGQGRSVDVPRLIKRVCVVSLGYTVVAVLITLSVGTELLLFFRPDAALAAFAQPSLRIVCAAALVMALSTVVFNGVIGTGNTRVNLLMETGSVVVYIVYCVVVIERWRSPLEWAWGSEFVYWIFLLAASLLYLRSGHWRGKAV